MAAQTALPPAAFKQPGPFATVWAAVRPIVRKPMGFVGLVGTIAFILVAFLGPVVIPAPVTNTNMMRKGPSIEAPLGTTNDGKSILILLLRGGRDILSIALLTGGLTTFVGVALGSLAAYLGGWFDRVVNTAANFLLGIPTLVLLTVLATVIRLDNPLPLSFLLASLNWPSLMRTVRSQVLSLRERDYIEAAVALDLGTRHIILNEILPNMASYIIINLIFSITTAIYSLNFLIFLGLVPVDVKNPNWGWIISTANTNQAIYSDNTRWWVLAPVLAIAFLQWFLITLARSIEDAFNPRLRSGG